MSNRPVAIDLFSGCGGISLGLEAAGFDIAASVEIDPIHALVHHYNFPYGVTICQDIRQLSSAELLTAIKKKGFTTDIDLVAGGSPCQGYSHIGRRSLEDPRNQLVFEYARIVSEIRPKYFIFENVPGLASGKHKKFLDGLIKKFAESHYSIVQPIKILDASLYGAPQKRKRLILIGYRNDVPQPNYPAPTHGQNEYSLGVGLSSLSRRDGTNGDSLVKGNLSEDLSFREPDSFSPYSLKHCLLPLTTVSSAISDLSEIPVFIGHDCGISIDKLDYSGFRSNFNIEPQGEYSLCHRRSPKKFVWGHLGSKHTPKTIKRFESTIPGTKEPVSRFFKLSPSGLSNTLRAGTDRSRGAFTAPRPIHYLQPRCLSIREVSRIHTFPDWFQFHRTIFHSIREIGNAVIPLFAKSLGTEITRCLNIKVSPSSLRKLDSLDDSILSYNMGQASAFWQVPSDVIPKRKRIKG